MTTDYAKKTNAELIEILKSRSLPHTGKKADMVARLQEDDTKSAAAPAAAEDVIDWEDDEVPAAGSAPAKPTEAEVPVEENAPKVEETKVEDAANADASQEGSEGTVTGTTEPEAQPEEKPAPNYAIGLSVTDLEEELKKRKARAEKFGITEDSQAAIDEAEKKLERAKRFGAETVGENANAAAISRLDQALPERSRKRGRGENDQGSRGGKRRNFNGRNNQRNRGKGGIRNNQGQNQGQAQGQTQKRSTNGAANGWSEKDRSAMEARKKRFAA
ncbi:hypothetical protein BJY01DRAFT_141610 [Aspergillus pseudoustus]|uniref:SAP domain-containing protein n=1 Tax=Aspergillus pseudoustus TaxID=1810923 RepID=A0ABR4KB65_9EURO